VLFRSRKIIDKTMLVSTLDFLCEIAAFKRHGNMIQKDLISYILDCGIPQQQTADYFNISLRQVRNCLNNGEEK